MNDRAEVVASLRARIAALRSRITLGFDVDEYLATPTVDKPKPIVEKRDVEKEKRNAELDAMKAKLMRKT